MNEDHDLCPEDVDAIAYGIAKLFHTPLDQLRAEAAAHREVVGSKVGAWANQALDYALNTDAPYVAVAYLRPPEMFRYDPSRWHVQPMASRAALDQWYRGLASSPGSFHYAAAFDKTSAEWSAGHAVAAAAEDAVPAVGAVPVHDQLVHLDHLVAMHETFWAAQAQQHPTPAMREFLARHWDPWLTHFTQWRPYLDTEQGLAQLRVHLERHHATVDVAPGVASVAPTVVPADLVAAFVREAARGLSQLRDLASYNGIPTPDLGTSQHGLDEMRVAGHEGGPTVYSHQLFSGSEYVGADGGYRDVASQAVAAAHQQHPSAAYGYLRAGYRQRVYLFSTIGDARAWYGQRSYVDPSYEYAAYFDAANLAVPVAEDFGRAVVSGDASVGHWFWPLALGLPLGALGGYEYRKWQESHPGKYVPWIGEDPAGTDVGSWPWYSIEDPGPPRFLQRGPWIDVVGTETEAARLAREAMEAVTRRRPDSRASRRLGHSLIVSATHEAIAAARENPEVAAFVWSLEPESFTVIVPFSSHDEALDFMRGRIQTPHVALAVFDRTSPHWPNPVNWTKSDYLPYDRVIAAQIAKRPQLATTMPMQAQPAVGAWPWHEIVGQVTTHEVTEAIETLRRQARTTVEEVAPRARGRFVGVTLRGLDRFNARAWEIRSFRTQDLAEDWYERVTGDPRSFTYASYFDKEGPGGPIQLAEGVGGAYQASQTAGELPYAA